MPKKGLISLQPEWLERERQRHEKQLADIDRKCNWLFDKKFSKTPAVIRMLEDLKISASFEMEMIMEIDETLSGQLACA